MNSNDGEVRVQASGRISSAPEFERTMTGTPVCRFMVTAAGGPASEPVVKAIYVWGLRDGEPDEQLADLAKRCKRGLKVGDRVWVPGVERQRTSAGAIEHAIIAEDVKLRERAAI